MAEHELPMRFPCWVIAEAESAERQELRVTTMLVNGKTTLQIFLEEEEAERFIEDAGLTERITFIIPTVQHLSLLMQHLQNNAIDEVHVISKVEGGFKLGNVSPTEFMMALKLKP